MNLVCDWIGSIYWKKNMNLWDISRSWWRTTGLSPEPASTHNIIDITEGFFWFFCLRSDFRHYTGILDFWEQIRSFRIIFGCAARKGNTVPPTVYVLDVYSSARIWQTVFLFALIVRYDVRFVKIVSLVLPIVPLSPRAFYRSGQIEVSTVLSGEHCFLLGKLFEVILLFFRFVSNTHFIYITTFGKSKMTLSHDMDDHVLALHLMYRIVFPAD